MILFVVVDAVAWLVFLSVVALIVECVQAVVYIPRARRAMSQEQVLAPSNEDRARQRGS